MLGKKENNVNVLRKSNILSKQAIDQVSFLLFLYNNESISKILIAKIGCYLRVSTFKLLEIKKLLSGIREHCLKSMIKTLLYTFNNKKNC